MPQLPLGPGEANRRLGRLPHLRVRNMMLERDSSNGVDRLAWLQRPGLVPFKSVGASAVDAIWQQDGTFNGDYLVISGSQLARVKPNGTTTYLGFVEPGRAQIVASGNRAIIVIGGVAYSTNGIVITTVNMPDSRPVSSVAFLDGYFFLAERDTQRVYFIEPGQDDPDGLAFFEAERKPDPLVSLGVLGDELWLIGGESEEVWAPSGDPDAPVTRLSARAYQNGCVARDTLVDLNGTLGWVSSDFEVLLSRGTPEAVSTPAIVEALRGSDPTTFRAWTYQQDSHLFYILTTNTVTLAYDLATQVWAVFSSEGGDTWRAHLGSGNIAGDSESGMLWRVDPNVSTDDGAVITREITGGLEVVGRPERINNIAMRAAVGWTQSTVADPGVEMTWSDDEGATWKAWQRRSLGRMGDFRTPVIWRKLGMMQRPGRLFRFRVTDDVILRISHVTYNEAYR
jgi:hypothetical protein